MEELFEINAYRFIDKSSKLGMTIYSRSREYAEKIIEIHNICSCCHWVPKKGKKFVKQIFVSRPPYELEQEQLDEAKQKLLRRQEKYAQKKGN